MKDTPKRDKIMETIRYVLASQIQELTPKTKIEEEYYQDIIEAFKYLSSDE